METIIHWALPYIDYANYLLIGLGLLQALLICVFMYQKFLIWKKEKNRLKNVEVTLDTGEYKG